MAKAALDATEIKVLVILTAVAILWVALVIPFISSNPEFLSLNPIFQYFVLNLGIILLSVITIGTVLTVALEHEYSIKAGFINGVTAFLSFSFVIDMWESPYAYDVSGHQAITGAGVTSSVDYMWGYIWTSIFPGVRDTTILFVLVYAVVPILAVLFAALVLSKGRFLKWLNIGGVSAEGMKNDK